MGNDESPAPTNESENGMVNLITGTGEFLTVDKQTRLGQYLYYMANSSGGSEGDMNQLTELLERIAAVEEALANKADASDVADLRWGQIQGSIANQSDLVEQLRAKATLSDLNALRVQLDTKADASDLEDLTATVEDLITTVEDKASLADLDVLSSTIGTKADASDLQTLSTTVAGKASSSDLQALADRVAALETAMPTKWGGFKADKTISITNWNNTGSRYYKSFGLSGLLSSDILLILVKYSTTLTEWQHEMESAACIASIELYNGYFNVVCPDRVPPYPITVTAAVLRI